MTALRSAGRGGFVGTLWGPVSSALQRRARSWSHTRHLLGDLAFQFGHVQHQRSCRRNLLEGDRRGDGAKRDLSVARQHHRQTANRLSVNERAVLTVKIADRERIVMDRDQAM